MSSHDKSKHELKRRIQELETENQKLKAEKTAMQEKANHLETVLDSIPDIVGIQFPDQTVHRFNQAGYDFLGQGPDKINGRKCYHLIGRDKPCDECASQEAIATTHIVEKEKYFPELDKHIKCCSVPVLNQSGNISYVVEILRDVTGRRKLEQALVESEERHRLAMQASRDGIWDWDIITDRVYFNPAYAHILGYSEEDVTHGAAFWKNLVHPEDKDRVFQINMDCIENRLEHFEVSFRMQASEGHWVWIQGRGEAVARDESGRATRLVGTHTDITQQKLSEEALRENEKRYRTIFENAPLGIFRSTPEGRFIEVNQALATMLGYDSPDTVLQEVHSIADQIYVEPEDRSEIVSHQLHSSDITQHLNRYRRRDGKEFSANLYLKTIRDDDGQILYLEGIVKDITERRMIEKDLKDKEEIYRRVLETAIDGFWIVNSGGWIEEVNQAYADMSGYSVGELVGMHVSHLEAVEDENGVEQHVLIVIKKGSDRFESRHSRKDGSVFDVEVSTTFYPKNNGVFTVFVRNITERKQNEEALRQSEIKFRNIFNTSNDAIFIHAMDGRFLEVNAIACKRLGFSREEFLHMNVVDIVSPDSTQSVPGRIQSVNQKGQMIFESIHRHKDGSESPVEVSSRTIQFEGSRCVLSLVRDISERKQAEKKLQKSEHKFRKLLDLVPDMISIQDPELNIVYSNWNGFGAVPEECRLTGDKCYRVYRGRDEICPDCLAKRVMETKEALQKETIISEGIWLDLRVIPLLDDQGQVEYFLEWVRDITERKQAEFALAESKREFESIFENSQVGIGLLRGGRVLHRGNQRLADILGYHSPEEMAGINMRELHLDEDHYEDFGRRFYSTLIREEQIQVEYQLKRKDGTPIWCSLSGKALDPSDLEQGVIWVLDELESRKSLENDLIQAIELSEAANRAKSEFLANMSHEIRTPLNGIMGMLQVMQATDLDQEQQEYVEMATKSSKRLARLLNDILDLTKIEAEKLEISEDVFSLPEAMQSIKDIFVHVASDNGNSLEIHHEPVLPEKLIGDSTRLTQILFNLVGNAAKYTHQGRIEVQAAELPRVQDNTCRVLFTISDTGAGIPDDKVDKIFETFTQAGNNLSPYTRQHEGAGLGLPLVKRLVKLMGGTLAFDSREGVGTSVYVSLPFQVIDVAEPNGDGDSAERRHDHARGLKILVVENDRMTQFYLRKVLEKSGVHVEIAENGQEALGMLNRSHFDCILMDIQMPILDGVAATKKIRAMEGNIKDIPIIAMTAYAMSGDKEKFLDSGMNDYIAKPVDHEDLMLVLKRNLSV